MDKVPHEGMNFSAGITAETGPGSLNEMVLFAIKELAVELVAGLHMGPVGLAPVSWFFAQFSPIRDSSVVRRA